MPELPEVETVCRGLAAGLAGQKITLVDVRREGLRTPFPDNMAERLKGRKISAVKRRAKYILVELDDGQIILMHLGMSGRLLLSDDENAPAAKHDHLIFHFAGSGRKRLTFNDPRRFGLCDLVAKGELSRHKIIGALGIEPLEPELTAKWLVDNLAGKSANMKAALLDQRIIAGLGNIYVCEALYYAGISPTRRARDVTIDEAAILVGTIRKVLLASIQAGGSTLRDYVQANGDKGSFQNTFAVYGREGERCPDCSCDIAKTGGIRRTTQNGRSSFECPVRQR